MKERGLAMELFLDTADAQEVAKLSDMLTIAGVTTNPTIITRSGKNPEQVRDELCSVLRPEQKLFMQTIASDVDGILADARAISAIRDNTYVKIPVTENGLRAIKLAKAEGIKVLATGIYSADEAFLAAMNGADYLAPYVNRMCNYGDGIAEVLDLIQMLERAELPARVCAASFKNGRQVHDLIVGGIHAVTVPPEVVRGMVAHPGTRIAVEEFTSAWKDTFDRTTFLA